MQVARPLTILQVATSDLAGGAERSAANLHRTFREMGHDSWLAVGSRRDTDPHVLEIPNDAHRNTWVRFWNKARHDHADRSGRVRGIGRATSFLKGLGEPMRWIDRQLGIEDFDFPGTSDLLGMTPRKPDIVHCHNLHGGYFDLRTLAQLSGQVPTLMNVRDAWLLSGHCAFSMDCDRWRRGCGECPDLTLFPAVKRDATAYNWKRKRSIFQQSRVYVSTPSQWLMDRVNDSMVAPAIIESRVIPNGVDTGIFSPGDKTAARKRLGIPADARVLMFAANGIRNNVWKDYETLRAAIRILGESNSVPNLILIAIGETAEPETFGSATIRFVPFQKEPAALAAYYRAADIYLHAARIESFGNVLLEARACGTPVVATSVGGIPEHVKGLDCEFACKDQRAYPASEANGLLTPPGDGRALANAADFLLSNPDTLAAIGANAVRDIHARFRVSLQAERFLSWYGEIIGSRRNSNAGRPA
jgi:glycosyltransferase involved in cell wall biosynthesis